MLAVLAVLALPTIGHFVRSNWLPRSGRAWWEGGGEEEPTHCSLLTALHGKSGLGFGITFTSEREREREQL